MQRFKRIIQFFDRDPYTIQINYKNKINFKSFTGGLISSLFYLASASILIVNIIFLFNQQQLIYNQQQIKNNFNEIYIDRDNISLMIIGCDEMNNRFLITPQNQEEYGLRVMVNQTTSSTEAPVFKVKATNCSPNSMFNVSYFCFPENFNMYISGRSDVVMSQDNKYSKLTIVVQNITESLTNITKPVRIQVQLFYINSVISPKNITPIVGKKVRLFYINDGQYLNENQWQKLSVFFKKLSIKTDKNQLFLNEYEYLNYTFFDQELVSNVLPFRQGIGNDKNWLVEIKLKRSLFTVAYDRHYKKIYTYLAESFGVIGLISIIFLLYKGYNRWRFTELELMPGPTKKTNLFQFYLFKVKRLKNQLIQRSQIEQEFEHRMDIFKILEKLQDFQMRLRQLEERSTLAQDPEPQRAMPRVPEYQINGKNILYRPLLNQQNQKMLKST